MPRVLTKHQAAIISKSLSSHKAPDTVVHVVAASGDDEAVHYAFQLAQAITDGKWKAQGGTLNPWVKDPKPDQNPYGSTFSNLNVVLEQGIAMRVDSVGPAHNQDPQEPSADRLLQAAFQQAGINMSSGNSPNHDKEILTIEVARRPVTINNKEPLQSRLARWIEGFQWSSDKD